MSPTTTTDEPVNRSCVIETISNPSAPRPALQAFQMLSRSHEAQTIVASLASDPNVWNAVMENPGVTDFFKSQHSVADFGTEETTEEVKKSSSFTSDSVDTPEKMESESHPGKGFFDYMRAAKEKVHVISRSVIMAVLQLRLPSQSTRCNSPVRTHALSKERPVSSEVPPSQEAAISDFAYDGEVDVPRLLNNSVPTFEEAKEATAELKDAIDRIYFSPEFSQYSSPGGEVAILSPTADEPVSRSCVIETISSPSVPRLALEAFRMLSRSCEAQTVVASLASDPNVWNAVLENPAGTSFFKSQHSVADFGTEETTEEVDKASSFTSQSVDTPEKMESESHPGKGFFHYMGG